MRRCGVQPAECWSTYSFGFIRRRSEATRPVDSFAPGNDSPADETNAADHETEDEHLAPAAFRLTSAAWFWNCADAVAEVIVLQE